MQFEIPRRLGDTYPALTNKPELVNEDCYGKAWMIVIEAADPKAADQLLDEKAYDVHVKASAH